MVDAAMLRPGDHGDVSSQIEDDEDHEKKSDSANDAFDVEAQQKVDWQWIFLQEKMEGEP